MQRKSFLNSRIVLNHTCEEKGHPCKSRSGGPAPSSMYSVRAVDRVIERLVKTVSTSIVLTACAGARRVLRGPLLWRLELRLLSRPSGPFPQRDTSPIQATQVHRDRSGGTRCSCRPAESRRCVDQSVGVVD